MARPLTTRRHARWFTLLVGTVALGGACVVDDDPEAERGAGGSGGEGGSGGGADRAEAAAPRAAIVLPSDDGVPSLTATGSSVELAWGALGELAMRSAPSSTAEERWTRVARGVRQSWMFATRPADPSRDLVVSIALDGARVAAVRGDGLELELPSGGRLTYGDAVWIDATGRRSPVALSPTPGGLELRVRADVVASSRFPALLDPTLSPSMDPEPPRPVVGGGFTAPGIACAGDTCLATYHGDGAIRGARVREDGTLLDPISFPIVASSPGGHAIARFGDTHLLFWCNGNSALAARVTFDGQMLDDDTFVGICGFDGLDLAASETSALAIWTADSAQINTRYTLLGTDIAELGPDTVFNPQQPVFGPRRGATASNGQDFITHVGSYTYFVPGTANPPVRRAPTTATASAWDGTRYLVTGTAIGVSVGLRDANGIEIPGGAVLASDSVEAAPVACIGGDCLVVWNDYTRAVQDGVPVGAVANYVPPIGSSASTVLEASDDAFHLLQLDGGRVRWAPFDRSGLPRVDPFVDVSRVGNAQDHPAAASDATSTLLVWKDLDTPDLRARYLDTDGLPDGAAFPLSLGASSSSAVEVAAGGGLYAVAQFTSGRLALLEAGATSTAATLAIATASSGTLAWNGSAFVVAWATGGNTYLRRLDPSGAWVDPAPVLVGAESEPRVVGDPAGGAWLATRSGVQLRVRRIAANGTVDAPITASASAAAHGLAWGDDGGLVVWRQNGGIYGRELAGDGTLGATLEIQAPVSLTGHVRVAWDGSAYVAVWAATPCRGRRVTPGGALDGASFALDLPGCHVVTGAPAVGTSRVLVAGSGHYRPYSSTRVRYQLVDDDTVVGLACGSNEECASGSCVDGVCCDTACGGDDPDDCQVCSAAAGATADGICTPRPAATVCRGAAGPCDVGEVCDGVDGVCPADVFVSADVLCRAAGGVCDVAESCTGAAAACPADVLVDAAVVCRDAAGLCDVAESCTGSDVDCPGDQRIDAGTTCRAAAGDCDAAEICDGTAADCPPDVLLPAEAVCRFKGGPCDVREACDGVSPVCPADAVAPEGTSCREAEHECDAVDTCDGTSKQCEDLGAPWGTPCGDAPVGPCDAPDTCSGGFGDDARCVDRVFDRDTECRPAAGTCDVPESCNGDDAECPEDEVSPAGTVCRPEASSCDREEVCDGAEGTCPTDAVEPDGTVCEDGSTCDDGACIPATTSSSGVTSSSGAAGGDDAEGDGGGRDEPSGEPAADEEGGCACRAAGGKAPSRGGVLAAVALAAAVARRRRTRGHGAGRPDGVR